MEASMAKKPQGLSTADGFTTPIQISLTASTSSNSESHHSTALFEEEEEEHKDAEKCGQNSSNNNNNNKTSSITETWTTTALPGGGADVETPKMGSEKTLRIRGQNGHHDHPSSEASPEGNSESWKEASQIEHKVASGLAAAENGEVHATSNRQAKAPSSSTKATEGPNETTSSSKPTARTEQSKEVWASNNSDEGNNIYNAATNILSKEEQTKKREKLSELLAKAAPPKFSSTNEEPMIMPEEHFAKLFATSSSLSPMVLSPEEENGDAEEELNNNSDNDDDEGNHLRSTMSYETASLVRHSLSYPSSETWAQLIGLIVWDAIQQIFIKANPTQIPSLIQRVLLLAWTGGPYSSSSYTGLPTTTRQRQQQQHHFHPMTKQPFIPRQPSSPLSLSKNYTPNIRGVANYGQTCFLNVVLHGLASLDSAVAYVEWIALEQDQKRQLEWQEYQHQKRNIHMHHHKKENKPVPTVTVSELLLPMLHLINGRPGAIDPRELLWRIAQKNTQFQSTTSSSRWNRLQPSSSAVLGQQQDAQEVLQALLGMMVVDAQLEKGLEKASSYREQTSRPLEPSFLEEKKDDSSGGYDSDNNNAAAAAYDEVLTVLSDRWSSPRSSTCSSVSGSVDEDHDETVAAAAAGSGMWAVDSNRDTAMLWSGMKMVDSTGGISSFPNSKEKDHKARPTNLSSSVDSMASSFLSTTSTIVTAPSMSSKQNRTSDDDRLSASMQIMLSTISSITPSPLCGWEGSVLQCQTCKHVRPIENSPFFMIPIVPTSMVMGPSSVSKDSSPPPPCTLEQCLHYYTQMERVSDVECANCTLQKELRDWQEEVDLLQGAVQSVERRRKQQQKNSATASGSRSDQDHALRMELDQAEWKVNQLKHQDPDNYELQPDEPNSPARLLRSEALKCLILTRCPSVLCLHVQRRYYDPVTDSMSKTLQHVIFDDVLDLAPFCAYGGEKAAAGFAGRGRGSSSSNSQVRQDDSIRSPIRYRLTCVIEHKGNAFGGHYVCYRRLPSKLQGDPQNPKWYFCSDETIQPTTWQAVRQCQAYMLLYEAI